MYSHPLLTGKDIADKIVDDVLRGYIGKSFGVFDLTSAAWIAASYP